MKKFIKQNYIKILILVFFILVHLPSLGSDIFNTDVWKWKARTYNFGTGIFTLNFEETIQKYHPGVTLMWIGTAGVKLEGLVDLISPPTSEIQSIFRLHFLQKLLIVSVISFCLVLIFGNLQKLFDKKFALVAVILLSFEPFYMALTRVVHLEGLMSTFMILSALYLYVFLEKEPAKKNIILSALFAALSFLTKTSSLYLIPFTGLVVFLHFIKTKETFRILAGKTLKVFVLWLIPTIVFTFLIWPALWTNFSDVINVVFRGISEVGVDGDHSQIYFGKLVLDPGPFYYLVVLGIRSSVFLVLGLLGLLFVFPKIEKQKKDFAFYFLLFTLFYTLELSIPSKKLDRYILPSIMSLILIASVFYEKVLDDFKFKKKWFYGVLVLPFVFQAYLLHPDYLSYYSPFFGGLKKGIYIIEPKWMIGQKEIITYFENVKKEQNLKDVSDASMEELIYAGGVGEVLTVGFPEKYYTQIWPFFRKINAYAVVKDLTPFAIHTKYFVYPVWEDTSYDETRFKIEFVDQIKLRGVPVYNVYRIV